MIQVKNLAKTFGPRKAVDGITFEVARGTVLGFLGPNGAGKTTTIRMIAGYLPPTSGTVAVNGVDVTRKPVQAQKHIGYLPESTPLYADMTVADFLNFIAEMRGFAGRKRKERVDRIIEACFLAPVRRQTIDTLSRGYRQRTGFAQTLIHDPPILLLDEPTEGLDPNQKRVVRGMISTMGKDKIIVLSTHILEEVEAVCSRVIIISDGKIVADSTPSELKTRSEYFNALTITVIAPRAEAEAAFAKIPEVRKVVALESPPERPTFRLLPREGSPAVAGALEAARRSGWQLLEMRIDGGRLDDVFRKLTITEDTR